MPPNSLDISGSWAAARRLCTLPRFESPEAEAEFWQDRDTRLYFFRRWMLLAGIFAFWIFFVIDLVIVEENLAQVLTIRFVATALALGLWLWFCTDQTPAMREALIGMTGLVTIGANLVMMTVAGSPTADLLPFAISMILAFGFGLVAPRFHTAVWVGLISYVAYWSVLPFTNTSLASILTNAHFLSLSVFAALVGTFVREKLEREQSFANRRLKELNAEAREANEAKGRLLASVSHELRTPVNAIVGFSEVMQQGLFGPIEPARYRAYVDDIHLSARLLKTGINDLLEVSRVGAQEIAWHDAVTPISFIVESSIATCDHDAREAGIRLLFSSCEGYPLVLTDPLRLTQVLVNLLTNAVKFSEPGAAVDVTVRKSADGGAVIAVIDTGCGIAAEDIDRVREPFAQGHLDQYSAHKGGLGLGLSIANSFVEKMDARLDIDSAPGVGTTMSIIIPPHRIVTSEDIPEPARPSRAKSA